MKRRQAGVSLIEVLITMVVIGVGLLGLAKIQAAAVNNTQITRVRSLMAMQTEALSAAMHGNKAYWAAGLAPASFTVTGANTVTDSSGVLNATVASCASGCTPQQMAAYDVKTWASAMNDHFPSYFATVNCTTTTGVPVSCNITVTWSEKYTAINSTTAASGVTTASTQSFTVYVQP
ncbi:type IV pilus modification protein PilV [Ralstonia sp. 24A2]|uniref:type IV pilus modification protein PilV n=1 Tax=Ralstonia sp. 24A2 TaxID=3447364 RepID=UPI003F69F481